MIIKTFPHLNPTPCSLSPGSLALNRDFVFETFIQVLFLFLLTYFSFMTTCQNSILDEQDVHLNGK